MRERAEIVMCKPDRYYRALTRNLYEVRSCLSDRNGVNAIAKVAPVTSWSFFTWSYLAFYNDMISHAIKVLDKHKDASSFWYLYRSDERDPATILDKYDLAIEDIGNLATKLSTIRNKTHFHIDKTGVFDPSAIWKEANIKSSLFNSVMEGIWDVLRELHVSHFGRPFVQHIYEGADIKPIIEAAKKMRIVV